MVPDLGQDWLNGCGPDEVLIWPDEAFLKPDMGQVRLMSVGQMWHTWFRFG